jgi:RNA polymerase sigma factor (sigma-70 family)
LIETLPESLRQPLLLSTVEELDYREIAAALEITEAAVRSRLFQARQRLKEKLENLWGTKS